MISYAASFATAGLCSLAVALIVWQLIPETVGRVRAPVEVRPAGSGQTA